MAVTTFITFSHGRLIDPYFFFFFSLWNNYKIHKIYFNYPKGFFLITIKFITWDYTYMCCALYTLCTLHQWLLSLWSISFLLLLADELCIDLYQTRSINGFFFFVLMLKFPHLFPQNKTKTKSLILNLLTIDN